MAPDRGGKPEARRNTEEPPPTTHNHAGDPADKRPAVILGVDPGLTATGYGVIEPARPHPRVIAYGCLRTSPERSVAERLTELHRRVVEVVQRFRPTHVAVESGFYGKSARSAMLLGQARGVALLAAAQSGCTVNEYSPSEVKRAVVGSGSASKPQVQFMVQALLDLTETPRPDHASDALAVAICHLHSLGTVALSS